MLPTQFIPEYYRDSKDIVLAEDAVERKDEGERPRRSLIALVLGLFRRAKREGQENELSSQERFAHR